MTRFIEVLPTTVAPGGGVSLFLTVVHLWGNPCLGMAELVRNSVEFNFTSIVVENGNIFCLKRKRLC
jgi:hypothetical protein